jgi:catechol 2,3-dioxygenase
MQPESRVTQRESIHPQTEIGAVALSVANITRAVSFYQGVLGLTQITNSTNNNGEVALGVSGRTLLTLTEKPGAIRQPAYSTGLYHVAILLPSRVDLARLIRHLGEVEYPLSGYADHLVSEAFYLDDPDGNGLELYRDRPRDQWRWVGETVQMASDPIDFNSFFAEIEGDNRKWDEMPAETKVGHIHLRVSDTRQTEAFYRGVLGFDVIAHWNSAVFLSAGRYHHHIGANTWQSRGAPPPPENSVGLRHFTILVPDTGTLDSIVVRLKAANIEHKQQDNTILVSDPSQNRIVISVG